MNRLKPEEIVITLRLCTRNLEKFRMTAIVHILREIEMFIRSSPDLVEWEEIDKLYERWFSSWQTSSIFEAFVERMFL